MDVIEPLDLQDIDPALRGLLQPTVDRLGYFGGFFQYASHAPDVLKTFMAYSGSLRAALPLDINEAIALTVCARMGFAYERIQHERLCETLGFTKEWIAALVFDQNLHHLTEIQRVARRVAVAMIDGGHAAARAELELFAAQQGPAHAVAAMFQITRFMAVCSIGRLLELPPPVPSIFPQAVS